MLVMKLLLVLSSLALLAGCAADEEDRAFFERGWVRPEAGADERLQLRTRPPGDMPARRRERR